VTQQLQKSKDFRKNELYEFHLCTAGKHQKDYNGGEVHIPKYVLYSKTFALNPHFVIRNKLMLLNIFTIKYTKLHFSLSCFRDPGFRSKDFLSPLFYYLKFCKHIYIARSRGADPPPLL
jgi:hypothetical protein